jgi:putative glutamine amidotransferase
VIGFLGCNEGDLRTLDFPYAFALKNARIRVLDYLHYAEQLKGCHGLVLPGGAFPSPKQYYVADADVDSLPEPGMRSDAYVGCFHEALFMGIPILGVCAGAQMIIGECGGLLFPDLGYLSTDIEHKCKDFQAHKVLIEPGSFLHKLVGCSQLMTNSRHKVTLAKLAPVTGFKIYAKSTDGVPEAWGSEADNILCIQWHPEDYVVAGDIRHKKIYQWLINEAAAFKKTQK